MATLPLRDYAALLCRAVGSYEFPAVTCGFEQDGIEVAEASCRESMAIVEKHIGKLLRSQNPHDVRNGLSNVIYWGWARHPGLARAKVRMFRDVVSNANNQLSQFAQLVRGRDAPSLFAIKRLKIPYFSQMSFTTKILMFLDPARYPILDLKVAGAFAGKKAFPPLKDLRFGRNGIRITRRNEGAYGEWSSWCRDIADRVNRAPASRRSDLRAVDVERALFTLVGKPEACVLLAGPAE